MSPLTDYQEARERVVSMARDADRLESLSASVRVSDLALLLSGPPVTAEEIARVILSVALEQRQPSRGDVFGWLDDNITPTVPGWVMVPREPTDEMIDAGSRVMWPDGMLPEYIQDDAERIYAAMLSALPPAPEGEG